MIPISFREQILPGTFENILSYLIDNELDLSIFDQRYPRILYETHLNQRR